MWNRAHAARRRWFLCPPVLLRAFSQTEVEPASRAMVPYLAVLVVGLLVVAFVPAFTLVLRTRSDFTRRLRLCTLDHSPGLCYGLRPGIVRERACMLAPSCAKGSQVGVVTLHSSGLQLCDLIPFLVAVSLRIRSPALAASSRKIVCCPG